MTRTIAPTSAGAEEMIPGPRGYPVLGILPKVQPNPLQFFLSAALEYGDVVRLQMGPQRLYLVSHPDGVRHVLQENQRNYRKGYDKVKPVFGEGLLSSEGEFWLRQRRLMQPAFHRRQIAEFATVMIESTTEMLNRWEQLAKREEPVDVAVEMMRLTQRVILRTMFSIENMADIDTAAAAFDAALEGLNRRLLLPFDFLDRLPLPANRRFQQAINLLDKIVYDIISDRRRTGEDKGDLLSMLLNARDEESGTGMSDKQLRDEVLTIYLAGHETTAHALSWTWYLLSLHPGVERRLEAEVAAVLGDEPPTFETIHKLSYTRMVIDEALRLYPPAWMFARLAIEADEVSGYPIPAGATIMLSPYVTHRHPAHWENPEGFDPERFTPEASAERPRFAYFPFGGGPRLCIGKDFALVEAQIIIAMVTQRFRLDLVPAQRIQPRPIATLQPRPGILMRLRKRRLPRSA